VRTSLDPEIQLAARDALREGLLRYHGGRAWSGPIASIDVGEGNWAGQLVSSPLGINYRDSASASLPAAADHRRGSALLMALRHRYRACPTRSKRAT
jgi:membrane carboxypeptidase/penicillin-binding protein